MTITFHLGIRVFWTRKKDWFVKSPNKGKQVASQNWMFNVTWRWQIGLRSKYRVHLVRTCKTPGMPISVAFSNIILRLNYNICGNNPCCFEFCFFSIICTIVTDMCIDKASTGSHYLPRKKTKKKQHSHWVRLTSWGSPDRESSSQPSTCSSCSEVSFPRRQDVYLAQKSLHSSLTFSISSRWIRSTWTPLIIWEN